MGGVGSDAGQARMDGTAAAAPSCKVEDGTAAVTADTQKDGVSATAGTHNKKTGGAHAPQDATTTDHAGTTGVLQSKAATVVAPPSVFTGAVGRCLHLVHTCAMFVLFLFGVCLGSTSGIHFAILDVVGARGMYVFGYA